MTQHKTFLNWSGGKDALFALHHKSEEFSIEKLVTTFNSENNRVNMHGLRRELIERQAESLGIPLLPIYLKSDISLEDYNQVMKRQFENLKKSGFTHSMYGDILLEDLMAYREEQLQQVGLKTVYPLWKKDTHKMIRDFIAAGYKTVVVVTNDKLLSASFCGRVLDENFLKDLPAEVDPCGENGEFHTFVFDGPLFEKPIGFEFGEIVQKKYNPSEKDKEEDCHQEETQSWDTNFSFIDLLPT
ncbi:MAG TPA: diphthine--ammonia ligase [Flavobacteriaceae bacterium]|nr:diphthine--ammonia ligase [Flavobacteriaceae bacterium]